MGSDRTVEVDRRGRREGEKEGGGDELTNQSTEFILSR